MADEYWYAVRCVFHWVESEGTPFEERITIWLAADIETAIELAEAEARDYAAENGVTYLHFAQAYDVGTREDIRQGAEVFSLLRDSLLRPKEYLDKFFDTGAEHQGDIPAGT